MQKKTAKRKSKATNSKITVRPEMDDLAVIEAVKKFTGKKTASGALLRAAASYPSACEARDKWMNDFHQLQEEYDSLLDLLRRKRDIEQQITESLGSNL